ncbi:unnamed protein product [Urochloa humidicola]
MFQWVLHACEAYYGAVIALTIPALLDKSVAYVARLFQGICSGCSGMGATTQRAEQDIGKRRCSTDN